LRETSTRSPPTLRRRIAEGGAGGRGAEGGEGVAGVAVVKVEQDESASAAKESETDSESAFLRLQPQSALGLIETVAPAFLHAAAGCEGEGRGGLILWFREFFNF